MKNIVDQSNMILYFKLKKLCNFSFIVLKFMNSKNSLI